MHLISLFDQIIDQGRSHSFIYIIDYYSPHSSTNGGQFSNLSGTSPNATACPASVQCKTKPADLLQIIYTLQQVPHLQYIAFSVKVKIPMK
jgi:hypothetical protein